MAKEKFDFIQPIKDIPKTLKGFPKNLVRIWKDPVTNAAQIAERKKEIFPYIYLFAGLFLVFLILSVAIPSITGVMSVVAMIPGFGIIVGIFLLYVLKKAAKKFAALTCDGCGTMLDIKTEEEFGKYVSYEIVSDTTKFKLSHPSSNNGIVSSVLVTGEGNAVVLVSFVCPHCGQTKTFKYSITPFRCQREQKNVRVPDLELVKARLEDSVRSVLALYESKDRKNIPYTIQSIHHPNYENRAKPQVGLGPEFEGVTIRYHRSIGEMVEGLFIRNELNGTISAE